MRIVLLLLLFFPGILLAQVTSLDSLKAALMLTKTDSARIELNCRLSRHYFPTSTLKGLEYAEAAAQLAHKTGNAAGKIRALNLIGYAHLIQGEYDQGLKRQLEALKLCEQTKDSLGFVATYASLGALYNKINDYKRAHAYLGKSIVFAQKIKDKRGLSKAYNSLGNVYEATGNYNQGLHYFKKAAKLQQEIGDKQLLAVSLLNVGHVHLFLNRPKEGLPYLFQSLKIDEEQQNLMTPVTTLQSIAKVYEAIGQPAVALQYAKRSYTLALKSESSKKIAGAASLLKELYAKAKNYEQAYFYNTILLKHQNILDRNKQDRIIAEITTQYENGKKDLENQKLKAEKEKQALELQHKNTILVVAIGVVLFMLVLLIELFRSKADLKKTYAQLQHVNTRLQEQHTQISQQRNELSEQARVLQQQNQELEKHDTFKSKVFSIISHDLRAPFNSIKAILELFPASNWSVAEVQNILSLLGKEAEISLNMLNNLLVWSKAQLAESKVNLGHVNLHRLVQENIALAAALAQAKQLNLVNAIPENTIGFTDKERINFVLRNLLSNAIKFSFTGGSVTFRAQVQEENLVISVQDTGKGIPASNLQKLFTEQRFSTAGTSKERGTGLGLMLCKELIESLQGSITVTSEAGQGSTFTVTLLHAAIPVVDQDVESASI